MLLLQELVGLLKFIISLESQLLATVILLSVRRNNGKLWYFVGMMCSSLGAYSLVLLMNRLQQHGVCAYGRGVYST